MDGALGPVMFSGGLGSMFTFHAMNKTKRETFAKHRVIQAIDLIEDTGGDPIELSVQLHFHAPYTLAPSAAITALEALMDARIPVPFIVGSTPVGRGFLTLFVIEDVSSKMSKFSNSSLIVGDIDVKLLEYTGALSLAGPLSALGGALPGLSNAVARVTSAISSVNGALNIATTATGVLGQFGSGLTGVATKALGTLGQVGSFGSAVNTLSGAASANALTSLLNSLKPGALTQIVTPSASMMKTAIENIKIAGF